MSIFDRRNFIGKFLAGTGLVFIPNKLKTKLNQPYEFTVKTVFPKRMTIDEYKEDFKKHDNSQANDEAVKLFTEAGKILETSFDYQDTECTWRVVFASKEAFNEWIQTTLKYTNQKTLASAGYKISFQERYLGSLS